MRSLLRLCTPIVCLLVAALAAAPRPATLPPSQLTAGGATSSAHPYSNPVWWPLSSSGRTGCYRGNPGCPGYHTGWLYDLRTADYKNTEPVYSMGAGIVHIGKSGQVCGDAETRGNWLYIDHGAGLLSYYGHLGIHLLVRSGQYVSARSPLGYVGNTGYTGCKAHPNVRYLFVAVKRGGLYYEATHLYTCVAGVKKLWPQQLPNNPGGSSTWTHWNQVRNLTPVPATDAGQSCVVSPPLSAASPSNVKLTRVSSTILRSTWTAAPRLTYPVSNVRTELQEYYPTIHRWLEKRVHTLSATAATSAYTLLTPGRQYRVRVYFRNAAGWSAPSGWSYYTLPR